MEHVPAIVIGAGQAGLAASHELARHGVRHLVLEADTVASTWRRHRWRSFRLVSPNWLNRLPGYWYEGPDPDGFLDTAGVIEFLETYAVSFGAPVRTGVRVERVRRLWRGFAVDHTGGTTVARHVVVATGAFGGPRLPVVAGEVPPGVTSIHTDDYWAPEDLPPGGVLVVGAGQSGLQIADELTRAGRSVTVAVGKHGWVPRRLLGRDQSYWRLEMGDFQTVVAKPDEPSLDYPFSPLSRWGREDFNLRTIWSNGCVLAGHLTGFSGSVATFAPDLPDLLRSGDEYARTFVGRVLAFAAARGEPADAGAALATAWPTDLMPSGLSSLDLHRDAIRTVIWTTGYRHDYSWIRARGALARNGAPYQTRGVSPVAGLYFVGQHRLWEAVSGTIPGCGWVAEHVAGVIADRLASDEA